MHAATNLPVLLGVMVATMFGGCTAINAPSTASSASSASALPPKYLEVSQFQSCLGTKQVGTIEQWCMPASRPSICPAESWSQLDRLQGKDKIPPCQ